MNKKKLVSFGVAAVFLALGTTGLLLYLVQHNKPTKVIHTVFGLFFVAVAIFHIINNWGSLVSYLKEKGVMRLNREFLFVLVLSAVSVVGAGLLLPPFEWIEEFGEELRSGDRPKTPKLSYNRIETNGDKDGSPIRIQIEKDRGTLIPVIGIWAEDSSGAVENLFVPAKMLKVFEGEEGNEEHAVREGEVEPVQLSPEALAIWRSKATGASPNYEDVTPREDLMLDTKVSAKGPVTVYVEIYSLGKSEIYQASLSASGSVGRLESAGGAGTMLKGFAARF